MKKLGLVFKETSEKQIKNRLKESNGLFVIGYSKLKSPDLTTLRMSLKNANASLLVVKNSVARRALKDSGLDALIKNIEGPCALIFSKDEPVSASKVLYDFKKTNENLKLAGGYLKDRVLQNKDIEALALLPSKEILRAQVVMALNSTIVRLAMVLNGNLRKLVYCLGQIKDKKGGYQNG